MLRKIQIALALSVAWGLNPTAVLAQQAPDSGSDITRLNEITVSSTRAERRVDKVPNTVTVTPAVKIEPEEARDIKDVFRNEVDVSARAVPPLTLTTTLDLDTRDQVGRNRLSLEHRFNDINASRVQRAESRVYWQDAKVNQLAAEDRNTTANRTRDNTYRMKFVGLSTTGKQSERLAQSTPELKNICRHPS
jgi:hypothetical protein